VKADNYKSLEEFVVKLCSSCYNPFIHQHYIKANNSVLVEKLRLCVEPEFPLLKKSRCYIAFKDGLYHTIFDVFIPYNHPQFSSMVHFSTSACNYLDCEFTSAFFTENHHVKHPMECATPAFDTIMETQNLDGRTKFILMALIGRLFFSSNFLDKWEVVPYLKGIAGTGKSTLAAIISNFLDPQDVAIIANNCESTFGMMSLPDKYAWVAPEVKSDFSLNQAQFQSLVSCERMVIQRKFMSPWEGEILCNGIMAGNMLPSCWNDNSSSIQRRLVIFQFNTKVANSRSDISHRLKGRESSNIIRKVIYCYRKMVFIMQNRGIWDDELMSPHIKINSEKLLSDLNPLRAFVTQGCNTRFDNDDIAWCALEAFIFEYRRFAQRRGILNVTWTEDVYRSIFDEEGAVVRRATWNNNMESFDAIAVIGLCPVNLVNDYKAADGMQLM